MQILSETNKFRDLKVSNDENSQSKEVKNKKSANLSPSFLTLGREFIYKQFLNSSAVKTPGCGNYKPIIDSG